MAIGCTQCSHFFSGCRRLEEWRKCVCSAQAMPFTSFFLLPYYSPLFFFLPFRQGCCCCGCWKRLFKCVSLFVCVCLACFAGLFRKEGSAAEAPFSTTQSTTEILLPFFASFFAHLSCEKVGPFFLPCVVRRSFAAAAASFAVCRHTLFFLSLDSSVESVHTSSESVFSLCWLAGTHAPTHD